MGGKEKVCVKRSSRQGRLSVIINTEKINGKGGFACAFFLFVL